MPRDDPAVASFPANVGGWLGGGLGHGGAVDSKRREMAGSPASRDKGGGGMMDTLSILEQKLHSAGERGKKTSSYQYLKELTDRRKQRTQRKHSLENAHFNRPLSEEIVNERREVAE